MSFSDIFKKSFLEGYSTIELGTKGIIVALCFSLVLGLYIFFCYRLLTRRTFYSKNFNISLVCMSLITTAIILLGHIPLGQAPMILVINAQNDKETNNRSIVSRKYKGRVIENNTRRIPRK